MSVDDACMMPVWKYIKLLVHTILHFVFYGNESWSLTSGEEQKLRIFKNGVLRIRGVKMEDVTGGRKKYVRRTFIICTPSRSITRESE